MNAQQPSASRRVLVVASKLQQEEEVSGVDPVQNQCSWQGKDREVRELAEAFSEEAVSV